MKLYKSRLSRTSNYPTKDFVQVIEPLSPLYSTPDTRLTSFLKALNGREGYYLKVTQNNLQETLAQHRSSTDVPVNNQINLKELRHYLESGQDLYQYVVCVVPPTFMRWVYTYNVLQIKRVDQRTLRGEINAGTILASDFLPHDNIYTPRQYIKANAALDLWRNHGQNDPLALYQLIKALDQSTIIPDIVYKPKRQRTVQEVSGIDYLLFNYDLETLEDPVRIKKELTRLKTIRDQIYGFTN